RDARALWRVAESWMPKRRPGEWNQAVMELGATVCTPRAPRCPACPVREMCGAYALGRVEEFPPVAPRRAAEHVRRALALVDARGRYLVVKRRGALLPGLWGPPGVGVAGVTSPRRALATVLAGPRVG